MKKCFFRSLVSAVILHTSIPVFANTNTNNHNSARILCNITGAVNKPVELYTPVNGFSNHTVIDTGNIFELDTNKSFDKEFLITQPTFVKIQIDCRPVWLVISPGDNMEVTINLEKIKKDTNTGWLSIKGNNAEGNTYFNNYNFDPFTKFAPISRIFGNLAQCRDHLIGAVTDSINVSIAPFSKMLQKKQISNAFYQLVTKSIKANLLSEAMNRFLRPTKIRNRFTREEQEKIFSDIFRYLDPNDPDLERGNQTHYYLIDHLNYRLYQKLNIPFGDPLPDSVITIAGDEKLTIEKSYLWILAETNMRRKESLWGLQLCGIMRLLPDYEAIKTDAAAYRHFFEKSPFLVPVDNFLKNMAAENETPANSNNAIILPQNTSPINSIDQLPSSHSSLSGKLIYIDLWATWCMPCLQEFKPNKTVDDFIARNNIARLYLSFDEPGQQNLWQKTIRNYRLGGYHLLAGKALKQDILSKVFDGSNSYSIPRFIIINTDGTIINPDAPRPSDGQQLIQTFNHILNPPLASAKDTKPDNITIQKREFNKDFTAIEPKQQ